MKAFGMVRSDKQQRTSSNNDRLLKRMKLRSLIHEQLEERQLLAFSIASGVYAEGTSLEYVNDFEAQLRGTLNTNAIFDNSDSRWVRTASGNFNTSGSPAVVTWSIVPDGTEFRDGNGNVVGTSNFIDWMDSIYGGGTGAIEDRPWFNLIERQYEDVAARSGLTFIYEPNDDGVPIEQTQNGQGELGVRGDMRIMGMNIDGDGGVLAFNFFPDNGNGTGAAGDAVFDTNDSTYFSNAQPPQQENRFFSNIYQHEFGHGIGLQHSFPVSQSKLLEPFINTGFLGYQHDDIIRVQTQYGDANEPNNSAPSATDLGTVVNGAIRQSELSLNGNSDLDYFSFNAATTGQITVTLTPTGEQFVRGPSAGNTSFVDTASSRNLRLILEDSAGNVLADQDVNGLGESEIIADFDLPTIGEYFIRVEGTAGFTQIYDLEILGTGFVGTNPDVRAPRLLSVTPIGGDIFNINRVNSLIEAPRELIFRFDGGSEIDPATLSGLRLSRALNDGEFDSTEEVIEPAFVGFGENNRIVIMRFAEPLVDDVYQLEILGVDLPDEGRVAVRNLEGTPLQPRIAGTDRDSFLIDLQLGVQVDAIVPQPIEVAAGGALTPALDTIDIYFNEDRLHDTDLTTADGGATVVDPAHYQLILTQDTVTPNDDVVFAPDSVEYTVADNRVRLTFSDDLHVLAGGSDGTFRLRVGSSDVVASAANPSIVNEIAPTGDPGATIGTANALGSFSDSFSLTVREQVTTTAANSFLLNFPGSNADPGSRQNDDLNHIQQFPHPFRAADANPEITQIFYTLQLNDAYGIDPNTNSPLFTTISDEQIARVREAIDFYSYYLGVDFVEVESQDVDPVNTLGIVVGSTSPVQFPDGRGGALSATRLPNILTPDVGPLIILDSAEAWDNGFGFGFGGGSQFFVETVTQIGAVLGLGQTPDQPSGTFAGAAPSLTSALQEWIFLGDIDVVHGQFLHRPDNRDADIYSFEIPDGVEGQVSIEVIAERLIDSSNLDAHLTLLRETESGLEVVAANDNYFSNDSFIDVSLSSGTYFVSITASGNEDLNPEVANTGSGGTSQGEYELKIDFTAANSATITDLDGTPLDGDGDGIAGGNFNHWFRVAAPGNASSSGPKTLYVNKEFAGTPDGSAAAPFTRISDALAASLPGDIVRLTPSLGADGDVNTTDDNPAYEIGRGGVSNSILDDGENFAVPSGVTVTIESGALLKFGGSGIEVGSLNANIDRSLSALQVLGTPDNEVVFTSFNDESIGIDTNPLNTSPLSGDWGGIDFRNNVDNEQGFSNREDTGVFLNYVGFANIRFGGGLVGSGGSQRVVAPLSLDEARPTLLNNTVTESADAGISADPNSFEFTRFTHPSFQPNESFSLDYDRVGPVIRGNILTDNSINGLFLRIDTDSIDELETLDVTARIDDIDTPIILGENLIVNGSPGGAFLETQRPDISLVFSTPGGVGDLTPNDEFDYRIVYVDSNGGESLPSFASDLLAVNADGAISLSNLPSDSDNFVARRLFRSSPGGGGTYTFVAQLDANSDSFVDTGLSQFDNVSFDDSVNSISRARPNGSLIIDPGTVIKSLGSRIEVGIGATLLAEGTEARPIVFTSRLDDRFGGAGTFDTNNDGDATTPSPGDWGGIVARQLSDISLDTVLVTFGGGQTTVDGGFASFNALEIHQARARVANSTFESNASGVGTSSTTNRAAIGPNAATVIFVTGAQPILINNTITGGEGTTTSAIDINANSLSAVPLTDYGRSTGTNNRFEGRSANHGPLIDGNVIGNNGINGLRVRGAILTTESLWDDTDIVHVLSDQVIVPDFEHFGGLRLQSSVNQSLVVKLNEDGEFVAQGRPLDNDRRIGGSLQIIGSPGFPVYLTSINDDTIGAGFDPSGLPAVDTDGNGPTTGSPGDWVSVSLQPLSNDRNVDTTFELEPEVITDEQANALPGTAQDLGFLARDLSSGDENLRYGFTVAGAIATNDDVDVYQFTGTAGTPVWFDIDRTGAGLDSVVELIDESGNILALSDNSFDEALFNNVFSDGSAVISGEINAGTLNQSAFAETSTFAPAVQVDFQSTNPLDAGLRVVLPGVEGTESTYFVRVRSSNVGESDPASQLTDPALVRDGRSSGPYRLQIRLQQTDEIGGSTVRFADIRFASTAIEAIGLPGNSPLLGELSESPTDNNNEGPAAALPIGNIANSSRGAVSIAGELSGAADIDWYQFSVNRDSSTLNSFFDVTFDIDYAGGLSRADTSLWVFEQLPNGTNQLVHIGTNSNIADDQPAPGEGADADDLSRGSFGNQDAFLAINGLRPGNYIVGISNANAAYQEFSQFLQADSAFTDIRLAPQNGVARLIDLLTPSVSLDGNDDDREPGDVGSSLVAPNSVGERVFVVRPTDAGSELVAVNRRTGAVESIIEQSVALSDVVTLPDNIIYGAAQPTNADDANDGGLVRLDITGNGNTIIDAGFVTFEAQVDNGADPSTATPVVANNNNGDGVGITALGHALSADGNAQFLYGVGSRLSAGGAFGGVVLDQNGNVSTDGAGDIVEGIGEARNLLFQFDPATGQPFSPPTLGDRVGNDLIDAAQTGINVREFATFDTPNTIVGLAEINQLLFGVSDVGEVFVTDASNPNDIFPAPVLSGQLLDSTGAVLTDITGLSSGPRGNPDLQNILFAITTDGTMHAFDAANGFVPAGVFAAGATNARADFGHGLLTAQGLDVSFLDSSLFTSDDNGINFQTIGDGIQSNATGGINGSVFSEQLDFSQYSANDLPTLYFDYFLDTNAINGEVGDFREAFRVYGHFEDGTSILLGTNNSFGNDIQVPGSQLDFGNFDPDRSNFVDPDTGERFRTQELFDITETNTFDAARQARIPLAPFAGERNVVIEFEFSTAQGSLVGDPLRGLNAFLAQPSDQIDFQSSITVQEGFAGPISELEFDFGLVLEIPDSTGIVDGSTIVVDGVPFEFNSNGTGDVFVPVGGDGQIIANLFETVLTNAGFDVSQSIENPNRISIANLAPGSLNTVIGFDPAIILDTPGVSPFAQGAIPIELGLDSNETAFRIQAALAQTLGAGDLSDAEAFPTFGYLATTPGFQILDSGSIGHLQPKVGDEIIGYNVGTGVGADELLDLRSINANSIGEIGVTISDLIIGFAERGERVSGVEDTLQNAVAINSDQASILANGGIFDLPNAFTAEDAGAYQLEIRVTDEATRQVDTNTRIAQSISLLTAPAGSIVDGTVFTLSDGVNEVAFEYENVIDPNTSVNGGTTPGNVVVSISPSDSAEQVAVALTNAINSNFVRSQLNISAAIRGESNVIDLHGAAAADSTGSLNFPFGSGIIALQPSQFLDRGDANSPREQGVVLISSNTISNSSAAGIVISGGPGDVNSLAPATGNRPYPGSPRNLVGINNANVAPGVTVVNNIVANNGTSGILVAGEVASNSVIPSTIARVYNNTVFGNATGISIAGNASPTVLNNILSSNGTGINDASPNSSTVLGANLYHNNGSNSNIGLGAFPIQVPNSTPLFLDETNNQFYPAAGSPAIDSSLSSLIENVNLTQIRDSIGLPPSTLLAPTRDVIGLLRVDDPNVDTPAGQGENVFVDRGAVDRVDTLGPQAELINPLDNDSVGRDLDRTNTNVKLSDQTVEFFSILINEEDGTGPDPRSITAASVILTENGRVLEPGVDYEFGYSINSRTVRLTPLSGQWRRDSVYEITLINRRSARIAAPAGTALVDGDNFEITSLNGEITRFEYDSGFILSIPQTVSDGDVVRINRANGEFITVEFNEDGTLPSFEDAAQIPFTATDTAEDLAQRFVDAIARLFDDQQIDPFTLGGGAVYVGGVDGDVVDVSESDVTILSSPGVEPDSVAIPFIPSEFFDSTAIAGQIASSVNATNSTLRAYVVGNGNVIIENVGTTTIDTAIIVAPIVDLAQNDLRPNRVNELTQFTIFMPEVEVDFGDAPDSFSTEKTSDGARHGIFPGDEVPLRLGRAVDGETSGQPNASATGDDRGGSILVGATTPPLFEVSPAGPTTLSLADPSLTFVGESFTISDPDGNEVTFEITDGGNPNDLTSTPVDISGLTTAQQYATAVALAIESQLFAGNLSRVIPIVIGNQIELNDTSGHSFATSGNSGITPLTPSTTTLDFSQAQFEADHELVVTDSQNRTLVIEIGQLDIVDNNGDSVDLADATVEQVIAAVAELINSQNLLGNLNLPVIAQGNSLEIIGDDEDGITFEGLFSTAPLAVPVGVTATSSGILNAWIDWNEDGDFLDENEQVLVNQTVVAGDNRVFIQVPDGVTGGFKFARFRLSSGGILLSNGVGVGGEVEDYIIEVIDGVPPQPVDDVYTVLEDESLFASDPDGSATPDTNDDGVLSNDIDPDTPVSQLSVRDEDPSTPEIDPVISTANGQLVLNQDGTFLYVPDPDFFGTDQFVYFVSDPRLDSPQSATVTINVIERNDAPTAEDDSLTIDEDTGFDLPSSFFTANDSAGPPNESGQTLTVVDAQILSQNGASGSVSVNNGQVVFNPAVDYNSDIDGIVEIELTITDDGTTDGVADPLLTTSTLFLDVLARNDAPVFTLSSNTVDVLEDNESVIGQPETRVANFVSNFAAGPATATDELASQTTDFVDISVSDPSLFTTLPTIENNGDLVFVTAPDANGIAEVVIRLDDDGIHNPPRDVGESAEQTFTINIASVNDAPTFEILGDVDIIEDQGPIGVDGFAFDFQTGPDTAVDEQSQSFDISIVAADPNAFTVLPTLSATGRLEFELGENVNINTNDLRVFVTISDSGPSGLPNVNLSETQTFLINAAPINDAPSFDLSVTQLSIIEDLDDELGSGQIEIPNIATNIALGPASAVDEVTQTVSFSVSTSSPELFEAGPELLPDGTLVFTPAQDQNGLATIVISMVDSGADSPAPNENAAQPQTLTLTITPINDAPQFDVTGIAISREDEGFVSVPNLITNILPGTPTAIDESVQTVNFVVEAVNPDLFTIQPQISPDGTLTYQTAPDIHTDSIVDGTSAFFGLNILVRLADNGLDSPAPNENESAIETINITVIPTNDPPIPLVDEIDAIEDQSITILADQVLFNDSPGPADEFEQSLSITQIEFNSDNGGVIVPTLSDDGTQVISFTYTPASNFAGVDVFRYVVTDSGEDIFDEVPRSATGTISVTVAPVNDAPQFTGGGDRTVSEDSTNVALNWASNIAAGPANAFDELSGPNAQTVSFEVVPDNPSLFAPGGLPTIDSNGVLQFVPAPDANGTTLVRVVAVDSGPDTGDNENVSEPVEFELTITPLNDAPAFDSIGNVVVDEDSGPQTIDWAFNVQPAAGLNRIPQTALDEQNQNVTFEVSVDRPDLFDGPVTISPDGTLDFTPASDQFGVATVTVVARDDGPSGNGNVNESAPIQFSLTVENINDAPEGMTDSFLTNEDTLLVISAPGVVVNDFDVDTPADSFSVVAESVTSNLGATVILNADGSFNYDPTSSQTLQSLGTDATASDTFTYRLIDSNGVESDPVNVIVQVSGQNDAPVANNDVLTIRPDTPTTINILDNDFDVDSQIIVSSFTLGELPINGDVTVSNGIITYTPELGFRGQDSFTYSISDSEGATSREASVTLNVNAAPVANNDSAFVLINETIDINILANDTDVDGTIDSQSVNLVEQPENATVVITPTGIAQVTPDPDFSGQFSFDYSVADNNGTFSNIATVTVTVLESAFQNPVNNLDVNADGFITPIDALFVINFINQNSAGVVLTPEILEPAPFIDVDGNGVATPLDALLVINFLNANGPNTPIDEGDGEGEFSPVGLGYTAYVQSVSEDQVLGAIRSQIIRETENLLNRDIYAVNRGRISTVLPLLTDEFEAADELAAVSVPLGDSEREQVDLSWFDLDEQRQRELDAEIDSLFE